MIPWVRNSQSFASGSGGSGGGGGDHRRVPPRERESFGMRREMRKKKGGGDRRADIERRASTLLVPYCVTSAPATLTPFYLHGTPGLGGSLGCHRTWVQIRKIFTEMYL
jgi:hypothetical protein